MVPPGRAEPMGRGSGSAELGSSWEVCELKGRLLGCLVNKASLPTEELRTVSVSLLSTLPEQAGLLVSHFPDAEVGNLPKLSSWNRAEPSRP